MVRFELFEMTGKKLMEMELTAPLTEISLSSHGLSEGIYLYQLNFPLEQNKIVSGKLVVR